MNENPPRRHPEKEKNQEEPEIIVGGDAHDSWDAEGFKPNDAHDAWSVDAFKSYQEAHGELAETVQEMQSTIAGSTAESESAVPRASERDLGAPRTMREEMDAKGVRLYSDNSGPTRFTDAVSQRKSPEDANDIEKSKNGVAAEKTSYELARDEYLRESKRFYGEHTYLGRLLSPKELAQLEDLKGKKDGERLKYADAMERSAVTRLKEKGKSKEYIERALEKYRGIIRYNEIVRPDREAATKARLEALGEKGPLLHEKILSSLSTSNSWMEKKMGKTGARAFRTTAVSIVLTGAAALTGAFGADNELAILGYGAARAGRSFASAAIAMPAGLFAGKLMEKRARNTQIQAKTGLESLAKGERRGLMTYDSLTAQDFKFEKLAHAADETTVRSKKAAAQIITAFMTGAAFSDALALSSHGLGGALHEAVTAKPGANPVYPAHHPGPHKMVVPESASKAVQASSVPAQAPAIHATSAEHQNFMHHPRHHSPHEGLVSDGREHLKTQFLNQWQLDHPGTMPSAAEISLYVSAHNGVPSHAPELAIASLPHTPIQPETAVHHEVPAALTSHPEDMSPAASAPPAPLVAPVEHTAPSAESAMASIEPPSSPIDAAITLTAPIRDSIQSHASLAVPDALYSTDPAKVLSPEAHAYLIQQVQHTGVGPKLTESITDYLQRITKASYAGGTHFYKTTNGLPAIYGGDFDAQRLIAYELLHSAKPGTRVLMPSLDGKSTSVGWMDTHGNYLEDRASADDMPMNMAAHDQGFFARLFGSKPDSAPPLDPNKLIRIN